MTIFPAPQNHLSSIIHQNSTLSPLEQNKLDIYSTQMSNVSSVIQLYYLHLSDFIGTHIFELSSSNHILNHFYYNSIDFTNDAMSLNILEQNKRYLLLIVNNTKILSQSSVKRISNCFNLSNGKRYLLIDIVVFGTDGFISAKKEIKNERDHE